jgi:hypothetical protein
MSVVTGASSTKAIAPWATYDILERTNQPFASATYDDDRAASVARCGNTSEMTSPSAAMTSSTRPYARSSESGARR